MGTITTRQVTCLTRRLTVFRRLISRRLTILVISIVITDAICRRRIPFRSKYMYSEEAFSMAFQVILKYIRMPFLVGHIMNTLINGRDSNSAHVRSIQVARREIRYLTSTTTPSNGTSAIHISGQMATYRVLSTSYLIFKYRYTSLTVSTFAPFTTTQDINSSIISTSGSVSRINSVLIPRVAATPCVLCNQANQFTVSLCSSKMFLYQVRISQFSRPDVRFRVTKNRFSRLFQIRPRHDVLFTYLYVILCRPCELVLKRKGRISR